VVHLRRRTVCEQYGNTFLEIPVFAGNPIMLAQVVYP
jgi:hypothetical protein